MDIQALDASTLVRNWWVVLLRGITGVLFGVCTLFAPGISLLVLVLLFGAYAFTDGIFALITAIRGSGEDRWWVVAFQGICGLAAAAVTLAWPGITVLALVYVIAAWAFLTGGLEVMAAVRLRRVLEHGWLLVVSGVLSVALGFVLALSPIAGALVLVLWVGAYALVSGVLLMALAFRLRSHGRHSLPASVLEPPTHTPEPTGYPSSSPDRRFATAVRRIRSPISASAPRSVGS